MTVATRILYRPVGLKEAELILQADAKAFPPRLPEQPYFYPVLNFEYAEQIARDWNTKDANSGYAGFVTEFQVDTHYISKFEIHTVGAAKHQELWIPAEELTGFNEHIIGRIEIKAAYYGNAYKGLKHHYRDWYADEIFMDIYRASENPHDISGEIHFDRYAIQLNFNYWFNKDYSQELSVTQKTELLQIICTFWNMKFPQVPLLGCEQVL